MDLEGKEERKYWAREVAALAAEGEDTEHIWMRLDLTRSQVEEIYRTPEFEAAMRRHGDSLWEAWKLTRAEQRQRTGIHQKIVDRADDYYERLHQIAMSEGGRDEVKAKILIEFLESARQLGQGAQGTTRVELSPASVKLLTKGSEILARHEKD